MNIQQLQLKLNNAIKALNIANSELQKIVEIIEAGNLRIDKELVKHDVFDGKLGYLSSKLPHKTAVKHMMSKLKLVK